MGQLRPMIREVMADLERQVGTKLEWIAVDHWDTDNPHTHLLVRRADGQDLFIPSKVMSHGIREKAQAVVTGVLGPRLEADIARDRWRETGEVRVTQLDRQLVQSQSASGLIVVHLPDRIAPAGSTRPSIIWPRRHPSAVGWFTRTSAVWKPCDG